jgi:hypothetical protein
VFGDNPSNALFTNSALRADARAYQRDDAQGIVPALLVYVFETRRILREVPLAP